MMTTVSRASLLAVFLSCCWLPASAAPTASEQPAPLSPCFGPGFLILWNKVQDVPPASALRAKVMRAHRPSFIEDVPGHCVDGWEIEATPHASIDKTGLITMHAGAPDGTLIQVTARVGKERVKGTIRTFDASRHPLKGVWRQVAERPCDSASERTPYDKIGELVFDAGGRFSVTLQPFESYRDYWGTFQFVLASGAVTLRQESGNKVPHGLQLQGTASVKGNELILNDVVLWPAADGAKLCSLRFTR